MASGDNLTAPGCPGPRVAETRPCRPGSVPPVNPDPCPSQGKPPRCPQLAVLAQRLGLGVWLRGRSPLPLW